MFEPHATFSSFSTNDVVAAKKFYGETLGLTVSDEGAMGLNINLAQGVQVFAYPKADHQPATFTVLNFVVVNIDAAVSELTDRGVIFERYDGMHQDEKGIARGRDANRGPDIAWFKDPAGNILSIIQTDK
jgi:catechol 2,3-dioxygenase-like lactoylglutathione lyase family enzyme